MTEMAWKVRVGKMMTNMGKSMTLFNPGLLGGESHEITACPIPYLADFAFL